MNNGLYRFRSDLVLISSVMLTRLKTDSFFLVSIIKRTRNLEKKDFHPTEFHVFDELDCMVLFLLILISC